jgi:hypothetical protein
MGLVMPDVVPCFVNRTPFTERPTAPLASFGHQNLAKALNL